MPSILPITKKNAYCKIFVAQDIYRFMKNIGMFDSDDEIILDYATNHPTYKFNATQIKEIKKDFNKLKNGDFSAELKHFEVFYEVMVNYIKCQTFKQRLNIRLEIEEEILKDNKINEDEYLQLCNTIKEAFEKGEELKEDCVCNIVAKYRRGGGREGILAIMVTFLPCSFGISYDNDDNND